MELRDALSQIAEIRQQMARGQLFRGYRAATTAFSGMVAIGVGLLQLLATPNPAAAPVRYVLLWVSAAAVCLAMVGFEMIVRTRKSQSQVQRQLTLMAVEQFVPAIIAGALLTYVFCDFLPGQIWMLPGLWMILFSLAVFASARLLPRATSAIGGYYLIAGVFALVVTHAEGSPWRYSPWLMAGPFGLGQLATAVILYVKLERSHGG